MAGPIGRWLLSVRATERLTPTTVRVTLGGDLDGFTPVSPDQQAKLFFPRPGYDLSEVPVPPEDGDAMSWFQSFRQIPEPRRPWMRSYSLRRVHLDRGEIEIDFVLHGGDEDQGPASRWAASARPGEETVLVGPAVSHLRVPGPHDWTLLAGDETALPAIGALLEAMPAGARAVVFAEVADATGRLDLPSAARVDLRWQYRGGARPGRSSVLVDAVRDARLPDGAVFAWVAGEASAVRAIRRHLVEERGVPRTQVAFTGYWRLDLTQDSDPTPEDAADAAEVMAELAGSGAAPSGPAPSG